jgi:hypothetical protein
VVTRYHDKYRRSLEISNRIEAYIQSLVLKKTLESISLDFRRSGDLEEFISKEEEVCQASALEENKESVIPTVII